MTINSKNCIISKKVNGEIILGKGIDMDTFIILIAFIVFIVIQAVYLGKRKFLGLLLPAICLVASIVTVFCSNVFDTAFQNSYNGESYMVVVEQNGTQSQHMFTNEEAGKRFLDSLDDSYSLVEETNIESTTELWKMLTGILLLTNLPTIVLLTIYIMKRFKFFRE